MADINLIVSTNADEAKRDINNLGNSVLAQVNKVVALERGYKKLDMAFNKGKIDAQKYALGIRQVDAAIKQARTGQDQLTSSTLRTASAMRASAGSMKAMGAATAVTTRRMGRGSVITQQAGYQVGDFLVQIQSGTNAMVAFGQQATQIAGTLTILGGKWVLIGSALGILIPLMTALGAAFMRTGTDASFLGDSLDSISPVLDALAKAAGWVKEAFLDMVNVIVNNLDRMLIYSLALATFFAGKFVWSFVKAKWAVLGLKGSLELLKAALIRTGIGILIVAAGELVYQLVRLSKVVGGFGPLLKLLKDAFFESIGQIGLRVVWLGYKFDEIFYGMVKSALTALQDILSKVNSDFVNKFIGMFAGAISAAAEYIKTLPKIFVAVFQGIKLAVAKGVNDFTGLIGTGINKLRTALRLEKISFGDVIDTSGMSEGNVASVIASGSAAVQAAYTQATSIDYVAAANDKLADAINLVDKAQTGAMNNAGSIADAMDRQTTPAIEALQAAWEALGGSSDIDVRDWDLFGGKKDDDEAGSESNLSKLRKELSLMEELVGKTDEYRHVREALADEYDTVSDSEITKLEARYKAVQKLIDLEEDRKALIESVGQSIADGFTAMVDGTMTVKDAFRSMARDIIKQLWEIYVVEQFVNAFKTAFGGPSAAVSAITTTSLPSADGGGYTGSGSRSGGMDGKGGFMAMLHPQETVTDHTKGQSTGGQSIVVNQSFNFSANGDDTVKKLIAQAAPKIAQMTKSSLLDDRRRGGATKAAFG